MKTMKRTLAAVVVGLLVSGSVLAQTNQNRGSAQGNGYKKNEACYNATQNARRTITNHAAYNSDHFRLSGSDISPCFDCFKNNDVSPPWYCSVNFVYSLTRLQQTGQEGYQ